MFRQIKLIMSLLLVFMLLAAPISPAGGASAALEPSTRLLSASDQGLSFSLHIPQDALKLEQVEVEGKKYTSISLPDGKTSDQVGAPMLPYMTEMLGVPFGVQLSISVIPGEGRKILLEAPILPVPLETVDWSQTEIPGEISQQPVISLTYNPDPLIYTSKDAYPAEIARVANDGVLRQQRVVSVALYPVSYLPAENTLIIYEDMQVTVRFENKPSPSLATAKPEVSVFEQILADSLLNYDQSKAWRSAVLPELSKVTRGVNATWTPPNPGWRITTGAEGLYHLSAAELALKGVPVGAVADENYHVFHLGTEIAIQVLPDDEIYFYAEAVDTKYTSTNVYWLTYDLTPGIRMQTRDGTPGEEQSPTAFLTSEHFEVDTWYRSQAPAEDDYEHYFWNYVYRQGTARTDWQKDIDLSRRTAGDLHFSIKLIGYYNDPNFDPDHHVRVLMNGTEVYTNSWEGWNTLLANFDVPESLLLPGTNTLKVSTTTTAAEFDYFWVDWFDAVYSRDFQVVGDTLQFTNTANGDWKYLLSGFSTADARVFDITEAAAPVQITGADYSGSGPYTAAFSDTILAPARYIALTPANILSPVSITADTPSNLQSTANQAEYLIISHANFVSEAQTLANYRDMHGINAQVIDVQDIYDEFSYGLVDPEAIRAFISFAYAQWSEPNPSYVLLVGDGNFDPNNHEGYGRTSFIPPYLAFVDPTIGETAADNQYVAVVGDDSLPDLMLGRLSVNTAPEAAAYIAKMIAYETTPPPAQMRQKILAITSKPESTAQYPIISDALLSDTYPGEPFSVQKVYWQWTHYDLAQARADILNGINEGRLLINYIGHAYYAGWGDTNEFLFTSASLNSLQNQEKLPFIMAMTCLDGWYVSPYPMNWDREALAERITRATDVGAVATWSPTGWGSTLGHDVLDRGAFRAIYKDGQSNIGAVAQTGYLDLWSSGAFLDLLDTYLIFGDPALRLPLSAIAVADNYGAIEDTQLDVVPLDGVLSNDINPQNQNLIVELVQDAQHGALSLQSDGSFIYLPAQDYCGEDFFRYRFYDGSVYSNTVKVTIQVAGINDHPPLAYNQEITTFANTPVDFTVSFSDPDECGGSSYCVSGILSGTGPNFAYTIIITSGPMHGTLNGTGPMFEFVPDTDYLGPDSFTFKVNDGLYESNEALVTISITGSLNIFLPILQK